MQRIVLCRKWLLVFALACVTALLPAQMSRLPRQFQDVVPRPEDTAKIEWLSKNELQIRSIDPNDDDFADLAPLKKILGDARVVQLGEQSHGDGATFYAKEETHSFPARGNGVRCVGLGVGLL